MKSPRQNFPTAAEALLRIQEWQDVPLLQRRSLASVVRLLCRIGGEKAPATVRLDPATCLPAMDGASAVALGLTAKSHQNYCSALRRVLRRLNLLAPPYRCDPISDIAWAPLVQALPRRFQAHRLRAFMGFCAARAIAPGDVTSATLEAHLRHRAESRGGPNPNIRADVREVARQWNKMRPLIAGWPDTALSLSPPEGQVQAVPLSAYPAGLQAEIERYLAWLAQGPEEAAEDDEAFHEPASPETIETRRKAIRLLLWGLVETGHAPKALADLVRFDLARQSLRWHRQRLGKPNPRKPAELLPTAGTALLADTLRSLAVYYGLTGEDDARFRRMLAVYRPKPQREITEDLSKLLDRLADPEVEARLLHLPQLLMHKARRLRDGWTSKTGVNHPPKRLEGSWMAALAAAIEIELHLPLRIHDLAHLRLDQALCVSQANGRRPPEVHLRVVASKNGRVVETWLRGEAAGLVAEYLRSFRPLGSHPATVWVFPNRDGEDRPRAKNGFSEAIADTIYEHTGVRVNVHAFRAFAAALILEDHPHAIEDIRTLLGHSYFDVALRHYRRTNRQGAAQRLSEAISKRRYRVRTSMSPDGLAFYLAQQSRGGA
jgi:integrase